MAANFDYLVQRVFAEDYVMVLALAIIASITGVLHTYLTTIYIILQPPEATSLPLEDYSSAITIAWRADGVAIILSAVGTWTIKINFMLFFFRLGHQIRAYKILWWVALVVIIACGAVLLGIIPYDCVFNDSTWVNTNCVTTSRMRYIYSVYQANVALDVLSDLISKSISVSKPLCISIIKKLFALADLKQRRSYSIPHCHLVEYQDLLAPKVCSLGNFLTGRLYYCYNSSPGQYLLWCL